LSSASRNSTSLRNKVRNYNSKIDVSALQIVKCDTLKEKWPKSEMTFGKGFTDYMLECDWDSTNGWHAPKISPFGNLSINPAASSFHYGIECFEGMKSYKDSDGNARLFRPDMNMNRLNNSMQRLSMPELDKEGFLACLKKLVKMEEDWVPDENGFSLYLRPTAIGTNDYIGLNSPDSVKVYCICNPTGGYFATGFHPVRLYADTENVRAWPGGTGNAKLGGNYGPTIKISADVLKKHNAGQILWLNGDDHTVTEVGAMNIFFLLKKKDGSGVELTTAPLSETNNTILPGVTRRSIIEVAHEGSGKAGTVLENLEMTERWLTMGEVKEATHEGRLLECFGAGTAAVINPVKEIMYQGEVLKVNTGDDIGPVSKYFFDTFLDIQYGRVPGHKWSVTV
jgi:branched-chain amino acid aminotransferase